MFLQQQDGQRRGVVAGIPLTNPYIPAGLLAQANALGSNAIGFVVRTSEFGERLAEIERQTARFVLGAKGDIGAGWAYDASYSWGQTTESLFATGQMNVLNYRNALNAIVLDGVVVCADPAARAQGCTPFDPFNAVGAPGVLHAPGSLCTYEPQWGSDVFGMYQSLCEGRDVPWSLLVKDVPEDKHQDLDFIIEQLDWEKNTDPYFKERNLYPNVDFYSGILLRAIGIPRAKEMIMTGKTILPETAEKWGLINEMADEGEGVNAALRWHEQFAKCSPSAVGLAKLVLDRAYELDDNSSMLFEAMAQSKLVATEDFKEGLAARIEKRTPKWKGK